MEHSDSDDLETFRSSKAYLDLTLNQADWDGVDITFGVQAEEPPRTFEELQQIVDSSRRDCTASAEIDELMGLLAESPERDFIVQRLPYDGKYVRLVLPSPEAFTEEAWDRYLHPPENN